MEAKKYIYDKPFELEMGGSLPGLTIAYHTYGKLNDRGDNVVWVCHALTANSEVADWWLHTVEEDKFLDPERYFVICANILGSCYGTTGPMSMNPATGKPYFDAFPKVTIRDIVRAHILLADALGLRRIHRIVGSSVGGFQAIEWAVMEPERFDELVFIASDVKASPWLIAVDETQRMAIFADGTYGEARAEAGAKGLAAARALGLLTYRGPSGYNATQQDLPDYRLGRIHRAQSYQEHQGEKLVNRFDAYSYVSILDSFDTHDVGRGRGGVEKVLSELSLPTIVVGLTTDLCFPPADMRRIAAMIPGARYCEIDSPFGHDGFLVEHGQLNDLLKEE